MKLSATLTAITLALGLLSACAQTGNPLSQVRHADERVLGYFQENGEYTQSKPSNGYERKLFGTTSAKEWVLQDFYAINGQAQTAPFTIIDERGLYDWDTLKFTNGKVDFFYADGKKQSSINMNKGTITGKRELYYRTGEVFLAQQFNNKGQLEHETFFAEDGKRLMDFSYDPNRPSQPTVLVFDEQGTEYALSPEVRELFVKQSNRIMQQQAKLRREQATLAGQTPPPEEPALE